MGLDMYLTKKTYIWQDNRGDLKISGKGTEKIKPNRVSDINEDIGYWRKANAIHQWFVDNVQDGVDECQDSYVDEEKLKQLLEIVQKVLAKPKSAPKLLPTQAGFFFGGTDYDEYYMEDLKNTEKIIKTALREIKNGGEIYYHSSW